MATVNLTVTDIDPSKGTFTINFDLDGSSDGRATAASMTALYIDSIAGTPEFAAGVVAFGENLCDSLAQDGELSDNEPVPAIVSIALIDQDIATGRYGVKLHRKGDALEEARPSTATLVGFYIRSLLNSVEFKNDCWRFADAIADKLTTGRVDNRANAPLSIITHHNDGAAMIAA